jgi:tyrosyl-tRNA synthetase
MPASSPKLQPDEVTLCMVILSKLSDITMPISTRPATGKTTIQNSPNATAKKVSTIAFILWDSYYHMITFVFRCEIARIARSHGAPRRAAAQRIEISKDTLCRCALGGNGKRGSLGQLKSWTAFLELEEQLRRLCHERSHH